MSEVVKNIIGPTIALEGGGRYFDYLAPETSPFTIGDIARALSHICRFGGRCQRFYSVAEHCVHASRIVPAEHALAALMHDASEAFVGDMPKPLKMLCPDYQAIEHRIEVAVMDRFGIAMPLHGCVKAADIAMLRAEQAQVMGNGDRWQDGDGEVAPVTIAFLEPDRAHDAFLDRFDELTGGDCGVPRRYRPQLQMLGDAPTDGDMLLAAWGIEHSAAEHYGQRIGAAIGDVIARVDAALDAKTLRRQRLADAAANDRVGLLDRYWGRRKAAPSDAGGMAA